MILEGAVQMWLDGSATKSGMAEATIMLDSGHAITVPYTPGEDFDPPPPQQSDRVRIIIDLLRDPYPFLERTPP